VINNATAVSEPQQVAWPVQPHSLRPTV